MSEQNQESELKTVRIATVEQLLGAGYIPEGRNLRGKDGSLLESSFLGTYAGKNAQARMTEAEAYPVTVDGNILPRAAVAFVAKAEKIKGVDYTTFSDGSMSIGSSHFTAKEAAKVLAVIKTTQTVAQA